MIDNLIVKIESYYLKYEIFLYPIIIAGYFFITLNFWKWNDLLGWIMFFVPAITYIICSRKKLINIAKRWLNFLPSYGLLFFISKMLAEKYLNGKFELETQYLNYTPIILAIIFSIVIGSLLILMWYFFLYWSQMLYLLAENIIPFYSRNPRRTNRLHNIFKPIIYIGLFMPALFLADSADKLLPYILLTDAYSVSSCGEQSKKIMYLQKNSVECYAIKLEIPINYKIVKM